LSATASAASAGKKDKRLEIRTTAADRDLFERAAAAEGLDLTAFATQRLRIEAQNVLADRRVFELKPEQWAEWQEMLDRPARDLPGLRALMARPSPWVD
jgi:uncharacterized protein (DUF1778 family)